MDSSLVQKKILHAGVKAVSFPPGTRVQFHYRTLICGEEQKTLDDSKKTGSYMELVIGKKFKFEIWETIVTTMALNEVASFTVDKSLTVQYPFVAKTLRDRDAKIPRESRGHCCGATLHSEGVGYDDLNELIKKPRDLEFILELIKVETPEEYEKESWQMDDDEKLRAIPRLKEEGNKYYRERNYAKASDNYATAIGMLEQLMLKEKPHDTEWNELNNLKMPILSNYSQCQLINEEYYSVIEHCSTILSTDPENVKAYFRRGKAHVGAWNPEEAEKDFKRTMELDPSLSKLVQKELDELDRLRRDKAEEDKKKLLGKLF